MKSDLLSFFIKAKPKSVNFLRAILSHKEQIALVFEQVKKAIRSFCSCRSLSKERIPNPVASAQYLQYLFILYTTVYMNMFSGPALPINYFWPNISTAGLSASVPYIYIYIYFVCVYNAPLSGTLPGQLLSLCSGEQQPFYILHYCSPLPFLTAPSHPSSHLSNISINR